jgi:hypothetical protein
MSSFAMCNPIETLRNQDPETTKPETCQESQYRSPQLIAVGKAINLLQGATGKHTDNYTGYYWNNE